MKQLPDLIFIVILIGIIFAGGYVLSEIPSQSEIYNTISK